MLDPSRHSVVEEDQSVGCDESSEFTSVRSRVTARLVAPTPASVPCARAAPAGDRGTAASTSLRDAAMKEIPGTPVHSSANTLGGLLYLLPLQYQPGSTRLGALPVPARQLNRHHLFLRRMRWMIAHRLS